MSRVDYPRVVVLVLNWNAWEVTYYCVHSLKELKYPNYEVVLIDNASTDGSVRHLRERFADLTIVANSANLGFAGGNNVGIRYALERDAQYVLVLNNDTTVTPAFLSAMIRVAESDHSIGILCPTIYYDNPSDRLWYAGGTFNPWLGYARHIGKGRRTSPRFDKSREVDFATGCALLVKSDVFRTIGLLDEQFFMVCEDVDFCIRAKGAGFKTFYVADAEMNHSESYTTRMKTGKAFRDYYNVRNWLLLARKHARGINCPSLSLCLSVYLIYRALGYLLSGQWDRIGALFRGLRDGIRQPICEVNGEKSRDDEGCLVQ